MVGCRWQQAGSSQGYEAFSTNTEVAEDLASQRVAEDTEWHETKREKNTDEISHPADGEAWKHFDSKHKMALFID